MVDGINDAMKHALAKIEGGKIKAVTDGDRVYLMIQDAPEELRRLYEQLPEDEQRLISETALVAASDAMTTVEGVAPRGENQTRRAIGRLLLSDSGRDGRCASRSW